MVNVDFVGLMLPACACIAPISACLTYMLIFKQKINLQTWSSAENKASPLRSFDFFLTFILLLSGVTLKWFQNHLYLWRSPLQMCLVCCECESRAWLEWEGAVEKESKLQIKIWCANAFYPINVTWQIKRVGACWDLNFFFCRASTLKYYMKT